MKWTTNKDAILCISLGAILGALMILFSGCASVHIEKPDGTYIYYERWFNQKIGVLEVHGPDWRFKLDKQAADGTGTLNALTELVRAVKP